MMVVWRRGADYVPLDGDPLVTKLKDVVLTGREPNAEDRRRAAQYNIDNVRAGKKFRAPVR